VLPDPGYHNVTIARHGTTSPHHSLPTPGRLSIDRFEGRSFVGWHRHVTLTVMAGAWHLPPLIS